MKSYEKSLTYQIGLTNKYFAKVAEQFFKELNLGLKAKEHLALQVIIEKENCCCRDLAKVVLQDRANTGRLVNSLEQKGFITIELATKNNRAVKIIKPTKKGIEIAKQASDIIQPLINEVESEVTKKAINETIKTIEKLRNVVSKTIKINI